MDPVRQYRERFWTLWILLKKILRFNDTKKNSWTLGSMELWGQYLVGRRNWVLLLDRYERERRITKNGVLWGSSMDHPARPGKNSRNSKILKKSPRKKVTEFTVRPRSNFSSYCSYLVLLTRRFSSSPALPPQSQLATPYHHYAASPLPHTARNTPAFYSSIILNKINSIPPRKKSFDNAANSCIIVLL